MFCGQFTTIPVSYSVYSACLSFNFRGANIFNTLSDKSSGFLIALLSLPISNVDISFR